MKRTFLFAALIVSALAANAQSELTLQQQFEQMFAPLDKTYMTTHILRNQTLTEINDDSTNGINNKVYNYDDLRQLYYELWNGAVDKGGMLEPDSLSSWAYNNYFKPEPHQVPIVFLDFQFDKLKTSALTDNLVDTALGQLFDVFPRPESPYEVKEDFMAGPAVKELFTGDYTFIIPSELYLTNVDQPNKIEIDFGDGMGFRVIELDEAVQVHYDLPPGDQYGTVLITEKINNGQLQSTSRLKLNKKNDDDPSFTIHLGLSASRLAIFILKMAPN